MKQYHYLIVGSGLFGATFARQMTDAGYKCLVVEKRKVTGGNIRCEEIEGINCHMYGPHIFHTNSEDIWNYVNRFVRFKRFVFQPVANYKGELYSLPFNMNTFRQMWEDVRTPDDARHKLNNSYSAVGPFPVSNLYDHAISTVGVEIFAKLIEGYTEKQWGRPCRDLPASILKRLPLRFTYDNNYFDDEFQGIPVGGYNKLTEGLLHGIEVRTGVDYLEDWVELNAISEKTVYTGPIDAFFGYKYGPLEYRSLTFETAIVHLENYQGCAVMNFTDKETPYTRIIEHKHFEGVRSNTTVITREYPQEWNESREPFYPVNDGVNNAVYAAYKEMADALPDVIMGGRLGTYKYFDMHQVIGQALSIAEKEKKGRLIAEPSGPC